MLHAMFLAHMQIPGCQNAYFKYEVVAGEDWQILDGMDNGITQVARQSSGEHVKAVGLSARGIHYSVVSHSMRSTMPFTALKCFVNVNFHFCSQHVLYVL
jgi:hypothetical protein